MRVGHVPVYDIPLATQPTFLPEPLAGHDSGLARWNQKSRVSRVSRTFGSARGEFGAIPKPPLHKAQDEENTHDLVLVA